MPHRSPRSYCLLMAIERNRLSGICYRSKSSSVPLGNNSLYFIGKRSEEIDADTIMVVQKLFDEYHVFNAVFHLSSN